MGRDGWSLWVLLRTAACVSARGLGQPLERIDRGPFQLGGRHAYLARGHAQMVPANSEGGRRQAAMSEEGTVPQP